MYLEDGYYWMQRKNHPYEIMHVVDNQIQAFDTPIVSEDELENIFNVNLKWKNKLTLTFGEMNTVQSDIKFGTMDRQIRHILPGDKLHFTLDGFLPPVKIESTDEITRLQDLVFEQQSKIQEKNLKIQEQSSIISEHEELLDAVLDTRLKWIIAWTASTFIGLVYFIVSNL